MQKASKLGLFLFILNFNVLTVRIFIFPHLYKEYGAMSYLYIILLILALIILFLMIPKRIYEYDFSKKYKNSKFKYLYNILIIVKVTITIFIGASIIKEIDYTAYNVFYFIFGLLFIVLLVSRLKNNEIVELSTWLVITAIILYLLAFLHTVPFDASLMKVFEFRNPSFTFYLFILLIYSDNLLILLIDKEKYSFNKGTLIFPIAFQFLFLSFELFQMIFSAGEILFLDYEWVGFISLSFQETSDYIGNLDFVYLYICTMATVINSAFMLSTVRYSLHKSGILFDIAIGVLVFLGCYGLALLSLKMVLAILLFVSIGQCVIMVWIGKEYLYARKAW